MTFELAVNRNDAKRRLKSFAAMRGGTGIGMNLNSRMAPTSVRNKLQTANSAAGSTFDDPADLRSVAESGKASEAFL